MRTLLGWLILSALMVGCHNIQVKRLDNDESVVLRHAAQAPMQLMTNRAAPIETELGAVYFERGSSNLSSEGERQIELIAAQANEHEGYVMIEGHANLSEDRDENMRLGYIRALETAKRLLEAGVWEERMVIKSYGASRPANFRWHNAEYDLNERVSVRVFPQGGRLEGKSAEKAARKTLPRETPSSTPTMIGFPIMQP